jgi:hypothetical protein
VVDLLRQRHEGGLRFEPNEFIETAERIAVGMTVSDSRRDDASAEVFKVFTFREQDDHAILLEDCAGRDDALRRLATE